VRSARRRTLRPLAVLVSVSLFVLLPSPGAEAKRPITNSVIAHIDTGINPYHEEFRDNGPLAFVHPSKYIPGYPKDVPALRLTLDAETWEEAFEADRKIWEKLRSTPPTGQMVWIPGTKIIGAIHMGGGGTYCPTSEEVQLPEVSTAEGVLGTGDCVDYPILDDNGHGTMTATRMAGNTASLCPACRIVSIEGLGDQLVKWAADQGWIDVQTNSWGFLIHNPALALVDEAGGSDIRQNLEEAAAKHLVYFGAGNGFYGFLGWTTWPTLVQPTLVEGSIWVGAHDNGKIAHWSASPPHVVADGYRPLAASYREISGVAPLPVSCCTSASSPYAAGQGAAIVLAARTILGDPLTGVRDGIVAEGKPPRSIKTGPLADGKLTLDELQVLVKHGAQIRPEEGKHDGDVHWAGDPRTPELLPYGPGGNQFCGGCWTLPVEWTAIPEDAPAYALIGYGAANEFSLRFITNVLLGKEELPDRSEIDEFFETEAQVRRILQHPEDPLPLGGGIF
jgi:subtilisin family serine protease